MARWQEVKQGRRLLLLIQGEAGGGKSRLLSEIFSEIQAQGELCLWADCLPISPAPLEPLSRALEHGVADWEVQLKALPPGFQAELRQLIPAWGSAEGRPPTAPDQLQARRFQALCALLRQLTGRQPLCLVLDDLHHADESSLQWLEYALRRLAPTPLLCLGSYRAQELSRDHPLRALCDNLATQGLLETWELPPLSCRDSAELLSHLIPPSRRGTGRQVIAAALLKLAAGNPFYLGELATGLGESGLLQEGFPDEARLRAELLSYLPQTLQATLQERLRRLSAPARRLLEVAAVLGRRWPLPCRNHWAICDGQRAS